MVPPDGDFELVGDPDIDGDNVSVGVWLVVDDGEPDREGDKSDVGDPVTEDELLTDTLSELEISPENESVPDPLISLVNDTDSECEVEAVADCSLVGVSPEALGDSETVVDGVTLTVGVELLVGDSDTENEVEDDSVGERVSEGDPEFVLDGDLLSSSEADSEEEPDTVGVADSSCVGDFDRESETSFVNDGEPEVDGVTDVVGDAFVLLPVTEASSVTE